MLDVAALIGFALAVAPLVLTPGASFTLVSARALVGDRAGAWAVIGGTAAGIATHAVLAGIGLASLVMESAELYRVVRIAGAVYLVGLGIVLLWRSGRLRVEPPRPVPGGARRSLAREGWIAFLANVLNVKAAAVYLTLAPQFVGAGDIGAASMLQLGLVHILIMAIWLGVWSSGLVAASTTRAARRLQHRVDELGGAILVLLGIRSVAAIRQP